jgi:hypothetical protein
MIRTIERGLRPRGRAILTLAVLTFATPLLADTRTWIGGNSAWETAGNWTSSSGAGQPANGDQVLIDQDGASVSYNTPINPNAVYSDLEINSSGANFATLNLNLSTLNTNQLFLGIDGKGAVVQTAGAMNVLDAASGMSMGSSVGGNGTYTLSNSAILTVAGQVVVGDVGTGTITQSGGQMIVTPLGSFPGQLAMASNTGSNGTYNLSGGSIMSGSVAMSPFGGNAIFNQSGGSVTLTADLSLGDPTLPGLFGQALYNHTGGVVLVQQLNIGSNGNFKQTGGTLRTTQLTIDTTGGKLDVQQNMVIDYTGGSPLATVRGYLKSGVSTGSGIINSSPVSGKSVGYAEASDLLGLTGTNTKTWNGQTVDATSILIRGTLGGDSNLDGVVDFTDLVKVAQNYGSSAGTSTWTKGDFDYDGNVGFSDLVQVAQNYGGVAPSQAIPGASVGFEADLARAFAEVPEPGVMVVVGMVPLLMRRRIRRYRLIFV